MRWYVFTNEQWESANQEELLGSVSGQLSIPGAIPFPWVVPLSGAEGGNTHVFVPIDPDALPEDYQAPEGYSSEGYTNEESAQILNDTILGGE